MKLIQASHRPGEDAWARQVPAAANLAADALLTDLTATIHEMPAGDVLAHAFAAELPEKLDAHLDERVDDDRERVARFAADPVPIRCAALQTGT